MPRALCEGCLESFEEADLVRLEGRALCGDCRRCARATREEIAPGGPVAPATASPPEPGRRADADPAARPGQPAAATVEVEAGAGTAHAGMATPAESPVNPLVRLRNEAAAWCAGRSAWIRLPLLLLFAYILVRHWIDADYHSFFFGLNFGIHEMGHYLFGYFGEFIGFAGGTLLQCLVPILSMALFFRQRDFFAIAICFGWLSTNLFYAGWYAADARAMAIPLLSPGGREVQHDWNYLLGAMGLLAWDRTIGFLFRAAASLAMLVCLAAGGWLLGVMIRLRGTLRVPGPWE
jgi:hypothetical protein